MFFFVCFLHLVYSRLGIMVDGGVGCTLRGAFFFLIDFMDTYIDHLCSRACPFFCCVFSLFFLVFGILGACALRDVAELARLLK